MADLDLIEGYEHGISGGFPGGGNFHDFGIGTVTIDTTVFRNGSRSGKFVGQNTFTEYHWNLHGGSNGRVASFHGALRLGTDASRPTAALVTWTNANGNLSIRYNNSTGKLQAQAATGSLTQDFGPVLADNTWYLILASVNTTANPAVLTARVIADGGTWDGTEGTVSPAQAAADITKTTPSFNGSAGDKFAHWDDILESRAASGSPAYPYPMDPMKVTSLLPTGDGTHNIAGAGDFDGFPGDIDITNATTNAYTYIDDIGLDSSRTDWFYDSGAATNSYVEVTFPDLPTGWNPVGVRAFCSYRNGFLFASSKALCVLSDGTAITPDVKATSEETQSTGLVWKNLDTPAGGWSKDKVDGIKARLGFSNTNGTEYIGFLLEVALEAGESEGSTPPGPPAGGAEGPRAWSEGDRSRVLKPRFNRGSLEHVGGHPTSELLDVCRDRTQSGTTEEAMLSAEIDLSEGIGTEDEGFVIIRGSLWCSLTTDAAAGTTTAALKADNSTLISRTGGEQNNVAGEAVRYEFEAVFSIGPELSFESGVIQRVAHSAAYANESVVSLTHTEVSIADPGSVSIDFTLVSSDAGTSMACSGYLEIVYGYNVIESNTS